MIEKTIDSKLFMSMYLINAMNDGMNENNAIDSQLEIGFYFKLSSSD